MTFFGKKCHCTTVFIVGLLSDFFLKKALAHFSTILLTVLILHTILQSYSVLSCTDKDWEDIRKMPEYPTLQKDFRRTT